MLCAVVDCVSDALSFSSWARAVASINQNINTGAKNLAHIRRPVNICGRKKKNRKGSKEEKEEEKKVLKTIKSKSWRLNQARFQKLD